MTNRSNLKRWLRNSALLAAATLGTVSTGQAQSTASTAPEGSYSSWNVSPFFGWQWFQFAQSNSIRPLTFEAGPKFGIRFTEDVSRYFSLEEGAGMGFNKAQFKAAGINKNTPATIQSRNYSLSVLGVMHLTPRDAKMRPFFVLGPGVTWYEPDQIASFRAPAGVAVPNFNLQTKVTPALVYGLGLKYNLNRNVGLRTDLRGNWTQQPHFGLPSSPNGIGSLYIPSKGTASALELSGGVVLRFGHHDPPPPPAPAPPPPPPPPPAPVANVQVSAITGAHDVCPGENLTLRVTASGWLPEQTPTYQWTVNDRPAAGANSNTFVVPTADGSGARSVKVTVSAPQSTKASAPVSFNIKTQAAPTIRFAVAPATIAYGDKVPLTATATASECTAPATIRYTASEGSISGNTYDSTGLSFDMNNRIRQQSKTVTLTATATDSKGQTARATGNVNVTLTPQAKRFDDIVFQSNSSRVNNCGKRILLEEVTPILRNDPNAKVILIGHYDNGERKALKLDDNRVLNAAAILSAGKGICPQLDLSRILVNSAGTDQAAATRPALCGSSVNERSGQAVKDTDKRAEFRRVEVWVVPGGAEMPAGTSGFKTAPQKETVAKACPR